MRKLICKIFQFLLSLASQLIDVVAKTLIAIGTAAVEVLGEVAGVVGDAVMKSPFGFAILAVGAYLVYKLIPPSEEEPQGVKS